MLAALVVLAPALAGCLGTAGATAMEHESTAEDEARAWADEPRLIAIYGAEGSFQGAAGFVDASWSDEAHWEQAREDPDPGDGHAELWLYRYLAEDRPNTVYEVVVDKDGEVLAQQERERTAGDEPLGEVNLDSDDALEAAKEASDGLRQGLEADNYGVIAMLDDRQGYGNPTWTVAGGGGDRSGGGGGYAVVDAVTGEVLEVHGGGFGGR